MLPPLIKEKTENDIHGLSPRMFILGTREYKSIALANYQFRILLGHILSLLSKQTEEEIQVYIDDKKRNLLFNELMFKLAANQQNTLSLDLIILSCIDSNIRILLNKNMELEAEFAELVYSLQYIETSPLNFIKKLKKILLIHRRNKLQDRMSRIRKKINILFVELSKEATHLQWNIAFNYVIEQNDILETALEMIKKNKNISEFITTD